MKGSSLLSFIIIAASLIAAMMLNMMPLPDGIQWLRPEWVLMVTVYWVLALPYRVSVAFAWIIGLLLDALYGTLLGEHALALVLVAYIAAKFHRQVRVFPLWQQAMFMMFVVFAYQAILVWLQGLNGEHLLSMWYWLGAITSGLFWPFVFLTLRDCRRRFKVQ